MQVEGKICEFLIKLGIGEQMFIDSVIKPMGIKDKQFMLNITSMTGPTGNEKICGVDVTGMHFDNNCNGMVLINFTSYNGFV